MNLTSYIDKIARILRDAGHDVVLHDDRLPAHIAGRYHWENRAVQIGEPVALMALIAIAHEAGHWIGYATHRRPESYQRERQAFVYGWRILGLVGAQGAVTRETWIRHHAPTFGGWLVDYERIDVANGDGRSLPA